MFSYHQKCKKNQCNFFKILLNNYSNDKKCRLNETQKRHYSFLRLFSKMFTFLDFDATAAENAIIYLKRRKFVFKLRQQIKNERIRWEEKKIFSKNFQTIIL